VTRIVLWFMCTLTVVVLLFGYSTSTAGPGTVGGQTSIVSSGGTPTTDSGGTPTAGATTVTGSVAQTRWGPVQVEITVADGTITDVSVVEYPTGNRRDREINETALPVLVDETIDAQSADIDMVSGATVTSEGYLESLQSALDQAGL
jgi:major membrane immunogen (membrane-anchored lipoprotein)